MILRRFITNLTRVQIASAFVAALTFGGAHADSGDLLDDGPQQSLRLPLEDVPSSHSVEESKLLFPLRREAILERFADDELPAFDRRDGRRFTVISMARFERGTPEQIAEVNLAMLDPRFLPFAKTGTDFTVAGFLCERKGDYDFALFGLTLLAARYWDDSSRLWPETRKRLLDKMLTETGGGIQQYRWFGLCGWWKETENHILLAEISQYIANQLWMKRLSEEGLRDADELRRYDNRRNGMDQFMLDHLQQFLMRDFHELNSRPYQKLTVWALTGLYEFAENPKVKTAAKLVLDYLASKFAVSSKSLRRSVPFRRQPQYRFDERLVSVDPESVRFMLYGGDLDVLDWLSPGVNLEFWPQVFESLSSYRVPDLVLDSILGDERKGREFWQGFHHGGWEIYSGSPSFLVSGGGRWVNAFDFFTGDLSVWAMPTTLIPAKGEVSRDRLIRILGSKEERDRNNLCVAPGFACGLNVKVPDFIPAECSWKPQANSPWTFFDFTDPACPVHWGFHVAVYRDACDSWRCRHHASNWGFFEVAEGRARSFEEFRASILKSNAGAHWHSGEHNRYIKSDGVPVEFVANPMGLSHWGIRKYGSREFSSDADDWSLAWGTQMRASGDGLVVFKNPYLGEELVLDYRIATDPQWSIRPVPTVQ